MLVSSIRVESESWYRVFGSGQKVGIDSWPGDQSIFDIKIFTIINAYF